MLYPKRKDILFPNNAVSGTGAQTISFTIRQEKRRLEAVTVRLRVSTASTAWTGGAWGGLAGLVKEIRIAINDGPAGGGSRNMVQISGIAALAWIQQQGLVLDRQTQACYGSGSGAALATSTTYELCYYVPLKHPGIQEPLSNVFSLPLSSTYLGGDVTVQVDLYDATIANTVIFGNTASSQPTYASVNPITIQTHLAEIPDNFPYLRSELRTDQGWAPLATSNATYEFTSGGFLTGVLMQGLSGDLGTSSSSAVTRTTNFTGYVGATGSPTPLLSSGGQIRLEYGREVLFKTDESYMQSINDLSRANLYPIEPLSVASSGSKLDTHTFMGEVFFDWLSELVTQDSFSLASCLNLNTDALGGDKFRVVFNDLAASTRRCHFTYHKILSPLSVVTDVIGKASKLGITA